MLVTRSKSRRWGLPRGWTSKVCLVAQSSLTVYEAMDCNPPGSSVHGIFQARILEWAAMPSSRGSFHTGIEPRSPALQVDSLPSEPPGKLTLGTKKNQIFQSLNSSMPGLTFFPFLLHLPCKGTCGKMFFSSSN